MLRRSLPSVPCYLSQWIEFEDLNGHGYAQPDAYLVLADKLLLFETKLSERDGAYAQLRLYAELLEHIFELPSVRVQVCKSLRPGRRNEISGLARILEAEPGPVNYVWHWLGI